MGPMFRAERPQAGRFRQFHQYGVEAIGSMSPLVDAEVILLCLEILKACGIAEPKLLLSSLGCRDDQQKLASSLRTQLSPLKERLCKTCQVRFDRQIFRILDCKTPGCQKIVADLFASHPRLKPGSVESLCEDCLRHFDKVRAQLGDAGIRFDDSTFFARGLDYYTRTVFEVRAKGLGAQDAVAGGGRYNHLVEELGGPSSENGGGAVGFAAGIERVLMAAQPDAEDAPGSSARCGGIYVAIAPPTPMGEAFPLVQQLRERGIAAIMGYDEKSLKAQLREADQAGCRFVAILGEQELKNRTISVKELGARSDSPQSGTNQKSMTRDAFLEEMNRLAKVSCHR
jgi:histidyl-tRNA synthetase